ncbi:type IV secretory system conjugative DNA transfer family protein [Corynebacterium kalidii]
MAGRDNPRDTKVGGFMADPMMAVALVAVLSYIGVNLLAFAAHNLAGVGGEKLNPLAAVLQLAAQKDKGYLWSSSATTILVILILAILAAVIVVVLLIRRGSKPKNRGAKDRSRIDHITRHLASRQDIATLSPKARKQEHEAKRLPDTKGWYGFDIGREVGTGQRLLSGSEDQTIDVWAPRQGKTTSRIIPQLYTAPGLVVATSCRRDLIDETVAVRRQVGEVWVFDPQAMAPEHHGTPWYVDPLDYIRRNHKWDSNAGTLAEIFEAATNDHSDVGAGDQNGFFYKQARTLLKALFLAAAIDNRPITDVFKWVMKPRSQEPLHLLQASEWTNVALSLEAQYDEEPRTRSNVFAAAANVVECLSTKEIASWVTPSADARKLDVAELAADETATLYLMTEEDEPTPRPLTSVLVVMLLKALETRAKTYHRERLPVPVTFALDEIANVVRWPQLPSKFSTYGGHGMLCDVVLQSYAQGVELWGERGMDKLWSAAAVRVIGPGQANDEFAKKISTMVGAHTEIQTSRSYGANGVGTNAQVHQVDTLPPDEVQHLPQYRMIVQATGRRPILARMVRWQDQEFTPEVEERLVAVGKLEPRKRMRGSQVTGKTVGA